MDIDLEDYRGEWLRVKEESKQTPSRRKGSRNAEAGCFLKGPIPWEWLTRANAVSAVPVALFLWREAGLRRSRTIRFRLNAARQWGISRDTARRKLRALESAGLICLQRPTGQSLLIRLLDVEGEEQRDE